MSCSALTCSDASVQHLSNLQAWRPPHGCLQQLLLLTLAWLQGCQRTIYLCDDGKDPKKRKWVDSLGQDVVYVSGRRRPPGEMNGKSGNLNNVAAQLYPKGTFIPGTELIAVFDADQVGSLGTPGGAWCVCAAC